MPYADNIVCPRRNCIGDVQDFFKGSKKLKEGEDY